MERGLEAGQCYFFSVEKLDAVTRALDCAINVVAAYPNPDLAIDVDISPSEIDRPGIYAALRIAEVWSFDGEVVTISRLGAESRHDDVAESGWLPVHRDEVTRWVALEDTRDRAAWARRSREWVRADLADRPRVGGH